MSAAGDGGVFISYRRGESRHVAGRLADRLIDRFCAERIFMDVQAIEPGTDFRARDFPGFQALHVRHESFRSDAGRLAEAIEQELASTPAAAPGGTSGLPSSYTGARKHVR
jgi:hypothetical protein